MPKAKPLVGILMGSDSDRAVMEETGRMLDQFGIPWELRVSSAHRSPDKTVNYVKGAEKRGIEVLVADFALESLIMGLDDGRGMLALGKSVKGKRGKGRDPQGEDFSTSHIRLHGQSSYFPAIIL